MRCGSARIFSGPQTPSSSSPLLCFVELLLPLGTFAQREHAAILFAAPALTALAVLAEKRPLSLSLRVIAGLAAGLVIAIKPHFALAIVPAVALAAWQARALRPMIPAAAAAVAVVALYAAAVIVFTPEYLQLLPMLAAAYLPLHDYWLTLLRGPVVIVPLAIYALALFLRPGRIAALPAMFLIASAGFAVAGLIQGKGYLNHALPGMALGFVGLVLLALEPGIERGRRNFVLAATAALAGLEVYAMASIQPTPGLAQAVTRVAPPRPSVITLGPDLLTGHPLVRNVNGRWAGSRAGMYIAVGAHSELSAGGHPDPRLLRWYEADVDCFRCRCAARAAGRHPGRRAPRACLAASRAEDSKRHRRLRPAGSRRRRRSLGPPLTFLAHKRKAAAPSGTAAS